MTPLSHVILDTLIFFHHFDRPLPPFRSVPSLDALFTAPCGAFQLESLFARGIALSRHRWSCLSSLEAQISPLWDFQLRCREEQNAFQERHCLSDFAKWAARIGGPDYSAGWQRLWLRGFRNLFAIQAAIERINWWLLLLGMSADLWENRSNEEIALRAEQENLLQIIKDLNLIIIFWSKFERLVSS